MTRYALLLRGVNVGKKNGRPTYVQSGNAVSGTKLGEVALTKAIERQIEEYMGRPIATTLRTLKLPLHGAVTTRNWNTVLKLVEMLDGA